MSGVFECIVPVKVAGAWVIAVYGLNCYRMVSEYFLKLIGVGLVIGA